MDSVLLSYLGSSSEPETQARLQDLMRDHVEPVLQQAVKRRMRRSPGRTGAHSPEQNIEDILADARLNVLRTLRQIKERPDPQPIHNLGSYIRTIADQAWDQQLRRMFPQRWRLKNQVRYLLTHHPDFALWETGSGDLAAGVKAWKGREPATPSAPARSASPTGTRKGTDRLARLLHQAFRESGAPMEIETLVNIMENWMGISDTGTLDDPGNPEVLERLPEQGDAAHVRLEHRIFLRRLWNEIILLPVRQRIAILLGLRDSSGYPLAPLLPLLDVASTHDIAEGLQVSTEEFANLWSQLPMDDRSIGGLLHVTPQQVINLRKCARQRLGRRMKWGERHGNVPNKLSSLNNKGEMH